MWAAVNEAENGKDWKEKKRSKDVGRKGGMKHNWQKVKKNQSSCVQFWGLEVEFDIRTLKLDGGNGKKKIWRDFSPPW